CGCLVLGSSTPPVQEVLEEGVNGLLVDMLSPQQIAARVEEVLADRERMMPIRAAARETAIRRFDFKRRQLPLWTCLLEQLVAGETPPSYLPSPPDRGERVVPSSRTVDDSGSQLGGEGWD